MRLAERLAADANYAARMSFAGRTNELRAPAVPYRVGGFGGSSGLAAHLRAENIAAVVDATHPFASRMSANAVIASAEAHVPLIVYTRPGWERQDGDAWIDVDDFDSARAALGEEPKTVFLAVGRQELGAFCGGVAHRYIVRSVDAPERALLPAGARVILARGPFEEAAELTLLRNAGAEIVVSKNSGGAATYGKIAAARQLGIPVIMIRRPRPAAEAELHDADAVWAWLEALRRRHDATA